jgi:tetratricopeptide (TPR) repeat protein
MTVQVPKLLALGFLKPPFDTSLDALESLLTFGVLSQLSRVMEIQTKDLTMSNEKNGIDARANQNEILERLQRIAIANRVQYVWTGQLSYALKQEKKEGEHATVKVNYWLYDASQNQLVLNEIFPLLREDVIEPQLPPVGITSFNQLINQITAHVAQTVTQKKFDVSSIVPLSTSLVAIHWAMRAYHAIRHEEKVTFYETALREDANMEVAYSNLARIYKSDQLYERSVLCYREALKHAHGTPRNRAMYATEAGIACALLGRPELALQWWVKAIDYDPTFLNPYFNLANIYEDQNNLREAEKYFLKAQKLAPDDFRTYLNLARLYSKLGEWEKALTQYQRQLETESEDPWCHSDVATCYLNLGDTKNAMQHLKKTVSLDPNGEAGQYAQLILSGISLN